MKEKTCDNCYWKTGDSCTYGTYPNVKNVCADHEFLCCECEEKAEFIINDEPYCDECALKESGIEIIEETIYHYQHLDGDYIGSNQEMNVDDVLIKGSVEFTKL